MSRTEVLRSLVAPRMGRLSLLAGSVVRITHMCGLRTQALFFVYTLPARKQPLPFPTPLDPLRGQM